RSPPPWTVIGRVSPRAQGRSARHAREVGMPLSVTPPAGRDLLAGKIVVVTAAAGTGIGSATARRCLEEGARVVVSDSHARRLAEVHGELAGAYGDRVWPIRCDVTDEGQVGALVAGAAARFGRVD